MLWVKVAAILGFLGVALGAFGAHGLKKSLAPNMLEIFETGVKYHLVHAVALLAVALFGVARESNITPAGALFTGGTLIFSGSLYFLSVTGIKALGAITPIGGLLLLAGWLWVAFGLKA